MSDLATFIDARPVRFERLMTGQIDRVWEYLTRASRLAEWLGRPSAEPGPDVAFDLEIIITEGAGRRPTGHVAHCKVAAFEPPRRLAFTWADENGSGVLLTFSLEARGDRTALVLTQEHLVEKFLAVGSAGWHTMLDALESCLRCDPPTSFREAAAQLTPVYEEQAKAIRGGA